MQILLVDDNPVLLMTVAAMLRRHGHEAILAEDGNQAWALLEREDIRFVISDWMMPGLDGPTLCRRIRSASFSHYVYFMLLTGREGKESLVVGMDAGADDFLVKPVDREELRVRVRAGERVLELEHMLAERNLRLQQAYSTIRQDLESAASMQKALLPPPAVHGGVRFEWLFRPSNLIGGDMFGYFPLDQRHLVFYLLDVAGHGIPSALLSFTVNKILSQGIGGDSLLRRPIPHAPYHEPVPVEEVVAELNRRFQLEESSLLYFTMVYGVLDTQRGHLSMVRAGHPAPIRLGADGTLSALHDGDLAVGMMPDTVFTPIHLDLAVGDRLVVYSDGISDCKNGDDEAFSAQRLHQMLEASRYLPLDQSIRRIGDALRDWKGDEIYADDISLLALERLSPDAVDDGTGN